jgi:predicted O-methyltransferase YrrM
MNEKLIYPILEEFDTFGIKSHMPPNFIGLWKEEQKDLVWTALQCDKCGDFVEIGAANGGSAVLLCLVKKYLQAYNHVISVDVNFTRWFDYNIAAGNFEDISRKLQINSLFFQKEYVGIQIGLVFIDGWHSFKQVLTDFIQVAPYLTKTSIIAFHDISPQMYCQYAPEYIQSLYHNLHKNNDELYNRLMNDESENFYLDEAVAEILITNPDFQLIDIPNKEKGKHFVETGLTEYTRGKTSPFNSLVCIQRKL